MRLLAVLLCVVLVVCLAFCSAYPGGAPLDVCSNGLEPGGPHGDTETGNGGFVLATDLLRDDTNSSFIYQANQTYRS